MTNFSTLFIYDSSFPPRPFDVRLFSVNPLKNKNLKYFGKDALCVQ